jgi:hypothetical protein
MPRTKNNRAMKDLVWAFPAVLAQTPAVIDRTTIERWSQHTGPRLLQVRGKLQILDREITSYNHHIDNPKDGYRKLALAYKAARAAFKKDPGKDTAGTALHHLSLATEKYAQIQLVLENVTGVCAGYLLEITVAAASTWGSPHPVDGTPLREVDHLQRFLKRQTAAGALVVKALRQSRQVASGYHAAIFR